MTTSSEHWPVKLIGKSKGNGLLWKTEDANSFFCHVLPGCEDRQYLFGDRTWTPLGWRLGPALRAFDGRGVPSAPAQPCSVGYPEARSLMSSTCGFRLALVLQPTPTETKYLSIALPPNPSGGKLLLYLPWDSSICSPTFKGNNFSVYYKGWISMLTSPLKSRIHTQVSWTSFEGPTAGSWLLFLPRVPHHRLERQSRTDGGQNIDVIPAQLPRPALTGPHALLQNQTCPSTAR